MNLQHSRILAAILAFGAGASGCSDEVSLVAGSPADATQTTDAHLGRGGGAGAGSWLGCQDLASAYCKRLQQCQPHASEIDYADPAVCVARETMRCSAGLAAPGAQGGVALLAACASSVGTASCDVIDHGGPPRCWFAPGARAAGAACAWDSQCQGKLCKRQSGENCGICATEAQLGEGCSPRSCAHGLTCTFDSTSKTYRCRARAKLGEPCSPSKNEEVCGYGLACAGSACVTAGQNGQACGNAGCDHALGLDCHKETKVCAAIPMGAAGASCSMIGQGSPTYRECRDGRCLNQNDQGNGTCIPYAADGGQCAGWTGPSCRPPARCDGGVCRVQSGQECL